MKLSVIRIKNINSLKGEHVISFDEAPLSEATLYAITGPTGAGKSTILDAICLALFNKIPRFSGKVTKAEIERLGSIMTYHTKDAFAEVDYEANGQLYRSTWSIKENRNGNLNDYEMRLALLPQAIYLDFKKGEIPSENERIIGLDYEQFIKAIMLSQGEFAKLLQATTSERTALLEQITDSYIYRNIGRKTYFLFKSKQREIADLDIKLSTINAMSAEDEANLSADLTDKKAESITKTAQLDESKIHLTQLEQLANKNIIQAAKITEKQTITQKLIAYGDRIDKIMRHEKLIPLMSRLNLLQYTVENALALLSKNVTYINQKTAAESKLTQTISKLKDLTKNEVNENNFAERLRTYEAEVAALIVEITNLTTNGSRIRNEIKKVVQEKNLTDVKGITANNDANQNLVGIQSYIAKLKSNYTSETTSFLTLKQAVDAHQTNISKWKEVKVLMQNLNILHQDHKQTSERLNNDKKNITILTAQVDQAALQATNLSEKLVKLTQEKELQKSQLNMTEYRALLEDEVPCPLCGATDHPYKDESKLINLGELTLKIDLIEDKLQVEEKQRSSLQNQVSSLLGGVSKLEEKMVKDTTKIAQLKDDLALCEVKIANDDDVQALMVNIDKNITTEESKWKYAKQQIEIKEALEDLNEIESKLKELVIIKSQYTITNAQKTSLYAGNDLSNEMSSLQDNFNTAKQEATTALSQLDTNQKSILENQANIDNLNNELAPQISSLGYDDVAVANTHILKEEDYQKWKKEITQLNNQLLELDAQLADLTQEIDKIELILGDTEKCSISDLRYQIETNQQSLSAMLRTIGHIENQLVQNEKTKIEKAALLDLKTTKLEHLKPYEALNAMIGDATGNKYAAIAQNLNLSHLLNLANQRLQSLNDRYNFVPTSIDQDLTVEDNYQLGAQRSVKTLSGGETFIISLGLALGLADMASKNVKLNSLFIDEGFGTLDKDTLETALETLYKLQAESDRTIGVISHVESMKERISTQIRVHKDANGFSSIEVVA